MQRTCAAERHEREVGRIVPALHRDDTQRAQHLRIDDVDDGRRIDSRERTLGSAAIELDAARQPVRQAAEQEIRVGHGRLRAAASVTGRPGIRACTLGPDAERTARIRPDERATAGADRVQIDGR